MFEIKIAPEKRSYHSLHMGRCCLDLYSNDVGAAFVDIQNFAAYVGGSPTNMSVGCRRLGIDSALLTAFGDDPVGDFVLNFLTHEGIAVQFSPRKPGKRTSCVVLGIEPPDKFPMVYYRENCADKHLDIDDVLAAPIAASSVFQFAGTNLSADPCRSATLFASEIAAQAGTLVVLDLDYRTDLWQDPRFFGTAIRSTLRCVDVVVGTQDEINAVMMTDPDQVRVTHSQVSDARVSGDTGSHIRSILEMGPKVVVEKRGQYGCRVHGSDGTAEDVPGFAVEIKNILGAGDAFGAGFICGLVKGWDVVEAARFGNACGAIVVTRHGCSASMPTFEEVGQFIQQQPRP